MGKSSLDGLLYSCYSDCFLYPLLLQGIFSLLIQLFVKVNNGTELKSELVPFLFLGYRPLSISVLGSAICQGQPKLLSLQVTIKNIHTQP